MLFLFRGQTVGHSSEICDLIKGSNKNVQSAFCTAVPYSVYDMTSFSLCVISNEILNQWFSSSCLSQHVSGLVMHGVAKACLSVKGRFKRHVLQDLSGTSRVYAEHGGLFFCGMKHSSRVGYIRHVLQSHSLDHVNYCRAI